MTNNENQFIGYGSKKNILDYIKVFYGDYCISFDTVPGSMIPHNTVHIFNKYSKEHNYKIMFFLEEVKNPNIKYIDTKLIIDVVCKHFQVDLDSKEKAMIGKFAQLESIFYLIFKYKICQLPLNQIMETIAPNPISYIIQKRFSLHRLYGNNKIIAYRKQILNYYLNKMEHSFKQNGNPLVIDFIYHLEVILDKMQSVENNPK